LLAIDGAGLAITQNIQRFAEALTLSMEIKITFQNECAWTAEFDWTLILSGEYNLTKTGSVLEFLRDYRSANSDTYIDQYRLTID